MQASGSSFRCQPASTSGRCMPVISHCSNDCSARGVRLLGRLVGRKTLLPYRRGTWLLPSTFDRRSRLQACGAPMCLGNVGRLQSRCSSARKRDVAARARSTAGQVGVAAVEEVVDAPHPEVLRLSSLSGSFASVRESFISIQNVESLTRELAEVGKNLERLAASEGASSSSSLSDSESEVSEEDYRLLEAARRQHEDDMKKRRELRAARRKASQEKAAAEELKAGAVEASSTTPTVASTTDVTRSGSKASTRREGSSRPQPASSAEAAPGAAARQIKAAAVDAGHMVEGSSKKLLGARATAAARTRSHTSWGKRHVEKAPKAAFKAPRTGMVVKAATSPLFNATKIQNFGSETLLTAAEEKTLSRLVQRMLVLENKKEDAMTRLGRQLSEKEWAVECGFPDLHSFRKAIKAGNDARIRMMKANERLVYHVARKYMNKGLDFEDLIAEGMSGLWRGVEKFDPDRGFKFSTYAHWWVRQAITRSISEQGRVVRLPVHLHELMAKVAKADTDFAIKHGYRPSRDQLAALAGITPEKLAMLTKVYKNPTSMNAPVGKEDSAGADTVGDMIADDGGRCPEQLALQRNLEVDMDNVLATLTPREAGILRSRYGLDDGRQRTLEEVGLEFNVTRERIRQIEAKAILKLRQPGRSSILKDYLRQEASPQSLGTWKAARSKAQTHM